MFQRLHKGLGGRVTHMFPYLLQQTCFQTISPACKFQRFTLKPAAQEHFKEDGVNLIFVAIYKYTFTTTATRK